MNDIQIAIERAYRLALAQYETAIDHSYPAYDGWTPNQSESQDILRVSRQLDLLMELREKANATLAAIAALQPN
jgi:hypothetical protein